MIPVFSNPCLYQPNLSHLHSLNQTGLLQAYQQQANLRAMNSLKSLLLASQEQALRSQLFSLVQLNSQLVQSTLKTSCFQSQFTENKAEDTVSTTSNSLVSPQESIHTPERFKLDQTPLEQVKPLKQQKSSQKVSNFPMVKAELEEMIYFLLNNIGKIDQGEIEKARRKYSQNLYLVPIFDALVAKYYPVKKHREDIVRYVVRKAFKYLKAATIKKEKVYGKRAYAVLCKKYFQYSYEELQRTGVNTEDEKELIEFLLPYRKNSKNRTMNNNFTSEIFSSPEFCKDYEQFLGSFDKVLIDDNNKKIAKLISLAEECVANNCPEKIKQCTRLPWLQAWIEKTQEVAYDLPRSGTQGQSNEIEEPLCKKVKLTQDSKSFQSGNQLVKCEGTQ